jgi:hypothetical protein
MRILCTRKHIPFILASLDGDRSISSVSFTQSGFLKVSLKNLFAYIHIPLRTKQAGKVKWSTMSWIADKLTVKAFLNSLGSIKLS